MRTRVLLLSSLFVLGVLGVSSVLSLAVRPVAGQSAAPGVVRTAEGKPDFSGIWQALNSANWDLQAHAARMGPVVALGAQFSVPGGIGVVEGNEIPYLPAAAAKKRENMQNALRLDPEIKCFMPGVPRAMYLPYPFQIVQTPGYILMAFEFANAARTVYMDSKLEAPVDSWMGWSRGHWDGDTLVVEVTDQNDQTWLDRSGNYHSNALKVTERYTALGHDAINYEATLEDKNVFSRPWKISMPLYRHLEKNAQLLEYKCVEFAEDIMYGHLRKPGL